MLKPLPFDQPVKVVPITSQNSVINISSVKPAASVVQIDSKRVEGAWPVVGPTTIPIELPTNAPTTIAKDLKEIEEIDKLERLKVAALVAIMSQRVFCFTCADSGQCSKQTINQTEFDFQSALLKRSVYERELANYRKISHANLVSVFKKILEQLLNRFYGADELRYDRNVLNFVGNLEAKDFDTHFSYSDHQLLLAKQYVYSALYDGQLLQFDSTILDLYCARVDRQQVDIEPLPVAPSNETTLEKTIQQIKTKTLQIFQRHKLFNQLVEQKDIEPTFVQLKTLCGDESIWNLLKTSPLEYENATSLQKAATLCSNAFENQSEETLSKLEQCGFFDDVDLFSLLMDQGCFDQIKGNKTRRLLLKKALQLDIPTLLTSGDRKKSFKRALWLIALSVEKLSKTEQVEFKVDETNNNGDAVLLLQKIYAWLKINDDKKQFASHRRKIESFLLSLKQYNLLLVKS